MVNVTKWGTSSLVFFTDITGMIKKGKCDKLGMKHASIRTEQNMCIKLWLEYLREGNSVRTWAMREEIGVVKPT
jgi:hypothetical protein